MGKMILADNQPMFQAGVAKILALQDDIRIVAQCTDGERLWKAVRTFHSSIILCASSLILDVPDLIQSAHRAVSKLIVIAEDPEFLRTYAVQSFDGVIFRDITEYALLECVQRIATGQTYFQGKTGRSLAEETDAVGTRVRERLTPKEIKIIALIVLGCKNKEIANYLGTNEQVIKNKLRNVFDKTGVSGRLELAMFTLRHQTLADAAAQAESGWSSRQRHEPDAAE